MVTGHLGAHPPTNYSVVSMASVAPICQDGQRSIVIEHLGCVLRHHVDAPVALVGADPPGALSVPLWGTWHQLSASVRIIGIRSLGRDDARKVDDRLAEEINRPELPVDIPGMQRLTLPLGIFQEMLDGGWNAPDELTWENDLTYLSGPSDQDFTEQWAYPISLAPDGSLSLRCSKCSTRIVTTADRISTMLEALPASRESTVYVADRGEILDRADSEYGRQLARRDNRNRQQRMRGRSTVA